MQQENKMGVMPINRLIISMSLPMMISMLVQALYNIVDSIFVSRVSENALTAVSMAFDCGGCGNSSRGQRTFVQKPWRKRV